MRITFVDEPERDPEVDRADPAALRAVWDNQDVREEIFSFLDIPSLGVCAQVSTTLHAIVTHDNVWEPHLCLLQEKLFDRVDVHIGNAAIVPICERPLASTVFYVWVKEILQA